MNAKQAQIIGLFFLIVGCAPQNASIPLVTKTLPAPLIRITRAADTATVNPPAPATIAATSAPLSDIEKLAEELFGERLIQSVEIPVLHVQSAVKPVGWRVHFSDTFQSGEFEWDSPEENVGWVIASALPDETGNILLYGHNNMYKEVFKNLGDLSRGDKIYLRTKNRQWEYKVERVALLQVVGVSEERANDYRKYIQPSQDARVTLISCYPPVSNTHRVVVIAKPAAP